MARKGRRRERRSAEMSPDLSVILSRLISFVYIRGQSVYYGTSVEYRLDHPVFYLLRCLGVMSDTLPC